MVMGIPLDSVSPRIRQFYAHTIQTLQEANIPFLVGGAYALARFTEIGRRTKDLDLFVRPEHCIPVVETLAAAGYRTEILAHWLGKVWDGDHFIDIIYSSANGVAGVDDEWFEHAIEGDVLGVPAKMVPPEEMLWSKAYIMNRDRFDGADIAHLLRACGEFINWERVMKRFNRHWRVLLSHLILFGFIYPAEQNKVPRWVMYELLERLHAEMGTIAIPQQLCQGTLLAADQYNIDIENWGYKDARPDSINDFPKAA